MSEILEQGGQTVLAEQPLNAEAASLDQLVTPAADRFVRCHFGVPELGEEHQLQIGGAVLEARRLSPRDLRALEPLTLTVTTECAGNWRTTFSPSVGGEPWGKGAISTAQWTGVPLRSLLALRDSAVEVLFTGADGGRYQRSLPCDAAMDASVLVAWEMNGAPIPPAFGGPLRLVVPGWYGMASVKWLSRIEAIEEPFHGEFQTHKYVYAPGDPVTRMRPKAMFAALPDVVRAGVPLTLSGMAWSGTGIQKVHLQIGGETIRARLLGPALPYAWRKFELRWTPPRAGSYRLRCRAIDVEGQTQPDRPDWNELGYGANGVEERALEAR
jgi:DMSO/TMAO reductase YedYZ molybdopterin-dependent catalytic subunit